jgi:hypothetical protein
VTNVEQIQPGAVDKPVEQLIFHLLRHPCDLVDTCQLMRRFHASVADVQLAIEELERLTLPQTKKTAD